MKAMLAWLEDRAVQVVSLHATEAGRSLYEELGFAAVSEMRLRLE